ncbi:MAG: hypothetical protein HZC05_04295 [Candidatus Magasanikbacteria bacterium]|nr:hypothetical protein [Candidatus Magasanikbacteria bacterium]
MQGSRVVVGMNRPGEVTSVVRRDTHRARQAFTLVVGSAREERRFEEDMDELEITNAVAWAELFGSSFQSKISERTRILHIATNS